MPRIPSLVTVQSPRISLTTLEPIVSEAKASKMIRSMIDNPDYQKFKNLKNRANAADIRMNIKIAEPKSGSGYDRIEIQMADASIPTSREAAEIVSRVFTGKFSHFKANIRDAFETLSAAFSSNSKGGVKTVDFNPKDSFAAKVEKALDDLIVDRELAKRG